MSILKNIFFTVIALTFPLHTHSKTYYFPKPTGPHATGTISYHWVDNNRNNKKPRELMAQIWYPAVGTKQSNLSTPLLPEIVEMWTNEFTQDVRNELKKNHNKKKRKKLEKELSVLQYYLDELNNIHAHSIKHAPITGRTTTFPIIIFSHGFACTRTYNTAHCENLASHGFVVVSVDHTDSCWKTTFPDGRQKLLIKPRNILDLISRKDTWAQDITFIIDKLAQLNHTKNKFQNKLDMTKIGMFGHSMGGIVTAHLCKTDNRICAGVTLDAPLSPKEDHGIEKPFMAMLAESHTKLCDKDYLAFVRTTKKDYSEKYDNFLSKIGKKSVAYKLVIQNTAHNTFCDQAILKEIIQKEIFKTNNPIEIDTGTLDGFYATSIINNYLVAFFNKFLKGIPPKPVPEVSVSTWGTQP